MRNQKKYIALGILLVLVALWKFQSAGEILEDVEEFRGANIKEDVFSPMIAQSINSKLMTVTLNDQRYTNESNNVYMSNDLDIMVSTDVLMEGLRCSARLYNENEVRILQGDTSIKMPIGEKKILVNGERKKIKEPAIIKRGRIFVPLQPLKEWLNFSLSWDMESNTGTAISTLKGTYLPANFDLRDYDRMVAVKDQGNLGTCWAFASLTALESSMLPEQPISFSADHMSMRNSFSSDQAEGGEYTMGMAYLTSWQGPVLEELDPYGDGKSPNGLKASRHVQEIQLLENKNIQEIKDAVYKYGAVQTSLFFAPKYPMYYQEDNASYFYNGTQAVNHDVVIIGWDDNFGADRFAVSPGSDGAFICQNSWGTDFGDGGVFYVSYEDSNIGSQCICYTGIESVKNFDRIYQSDLCGWGGQLGYNKESLYAANVFTTEEEEVISAAGFYATGNDTTYELFVVPKFDGASSLREGWKVAEGNKKRAGFYTVRFQSQIRVAKGSRFAVVLKINTPGATRPLAVEYKKPDSELEVDLSDGESYISPNGRRWQNAEKTQNCNICLKAYTQKVH